ncbi:hypothetical protein PG984_010198 [Apiospora sp. TS-2023a]
MSFHKFPSLPPEIRAYIWVDAIHQEAEGRLFFLHRRSLRILPTKNNISPFFRVNVEARQMAKSFYSVCLSVSVLPPYTPSGLISFDKCERILHDPESNWAQSVGPDGETWTDRERYWNHYAFSVYGAAAEDMLDEIEFPESAADKGCLHINPRLATNQLN